MKFWKKENNGGYVTEGKKYVECIEGWKDCDITMVCLVCDIVCYFLN